MTPVDSTQISALIADINAAAETSNHDLLGDEVARAKVLRASRKLSAALEKPEDAASGVALLVSERKIRGLKV